MKIAAMITRTNETTAQISEYVAKVLQASTKANWYQKATIPAIVKSPDIVISVRCIFPFMVLISPPASNGKNKATRTANNPLEASSTGAITEPCPLFIPQNVIPDKTKIITHLKK